MVTNLKIQERETFKMVSFALHLTQEALEGLPGNYQGMCFGAELPDTCISVLVSFSLWKHESEWVKLVLL